MLYCAGFGIELLNANGDVIETKSPNSTPYSWDEMTAALQLRPGDTTTLTFRLDDVTDAASFRITSIVKANEEKKSSNKGLVDKAKDYVDLYNDIDDALDVTGAALDLIL